MTSRRRLGWFLACFLLSFAPAHGLVRAQDAVRAAAIVLRVLSYDRNVGQRAGDQVTVLVLFRAGHGGSETEQREMTAALNSIGRRTTIADRTTRAVALAYSGRAPLLAGVREHRAAVIYACDGLDDVVTEVRDVGNELRVLTMTRSSSAVQRGLGVGLVQEGAQIRLWVNLAASQAQGARLDATLLRLAQVIR